MTTQPRSSRSTSCRAVATRCQPRKVRRRAGSGSRAKYEWLIKGKPGQTVELLVQSEKGGSPPSAIMMNSRSYEAFYLERTANGEKIANPRLFREYPVVIDDSLDDYEILLPGAEDFNDSGNA